MAKFVVSITYNKGVVLSEKYHRMKGLYFKGSIERQFACMFRDSNKGGSSLFVQDGDKLVPLGIASGRNDDYTTQKRRYKLH